MECVQCAVEHDGDIVKELARRLDWGGYASLSEDEQFAVARGMCDDCIILRWMEEVPL